MIGQPGNNGSFPDATEISCSMADIAEVSQNLITDFLARQTSQKSEQGRKSLDPLNIGGAFMEMTTRLMADPAKLMQANMKLWQDYTSLWQNAATQMMGGETEHAVTPEPGDRRFKDASWNENDIFDYIKQSYLLTSRWLQSTVTGVEGLDAKDAQKVDFYTRQFIEALSPNNFVLTNPQVLAATAETGGENLINGLKNLLEDLDEETGRLNIRMADDDAFEVGVNVAESPGKVVFRNDLMELIQFQPSTKTVCQTPLLIIPPWINKYYILDLRKENSFIRWAVGQGHTVFIISWVNPDTKLADKTFEDYMIEGPLAALDAIEQATGENKINAVGYCIGGTLLASTLAYMAAKKDERIKSATFFTTMVDFEDAGELGVFIDEEQITSLENKMDEKGYLASTHMASTFNMMRGTDLIWSFVRHQQLPDGQGPPSLRPIVLEFRFHPHAGGHAFVLFAQYVHGKQTGGARRHYARWRSVGPAKHKAALLCDLYPGGPHRAVEIHLRCGQSLQRAGQVRVIGVRSYCRDRQSAGRQKILLLDQCCQKSAKNSGRLVQRSQTARRILVAGLGQMGQTPCRQKNYPRPHARPRQVGG